MISLICFINACFAFAGTAAMLFGLLASVSESVDANLPAGTPITASQGITGALTFLGVYSLLMAIIGWVAVGRQRSSLALAFFIMYTLDTIIGVLMSAILVMISEWWCVWVVVHICADQ